MFGPIKSRRLGSSLGVNLLPAKGKLCNFDCIYCECGWNRDGMEDRTLPGLEDASAALTEKIEECSRLSVPIDSITFSGNGEPTLNPAFPQIVDVVLTLRDKYYPDACVSVLSNATMIDRPAVFEALRKVDNPILKVDGPDAGKVGMINKPCGVWDRDRIVEGLKKFDGQFVLQTMFLKAPEFCSGDWVEQWMDIVRAVRPREVMVYTIDRETPEKGLAKYSPEEMAELVKPLVDEGFTIQIRG